MKKFVLWSGGLDSTLLLYELARDNPTSMIQAITIKNVGNNNQVKKSEHNARNVIRKKIKFKNIDYHLITITSDMWFEINWQMPIWFTFIAPFLPQDAELNLGYLSTDGYDFWSPRRQLETAFNETMKLHYNTTAKIVFPFENRTKGDIIIALKKIKLLKYCWSCGNPKDKKPCGKCMKCISLKRWSAYPKKGIET